MAGFGDPVLPPKIWREILAILPVKLVLRCTSVCKSWYFLISCPNFISHHITNLPDKDGDRLLLQVEGEHGVGLFSCHDESCMESREHEDDCPDEYIGRDIEIVGSCNGLICVSQYDVHPDMEDFSTMTFLIWNPAIRKIVELPPLTYCFDYQEVRLIGFGFDSNTSDYKVMCYLCNPTAIGNDKCEIIDLNNGVWRSISSPPRLFVGRPEAECYVDGAVHWSLYRHGKGRVILSFNMSDESFREIRMPECAEFALSGDYDRITTRCVTFGGLVHVIVWKTKLDGYEHVVDVSESCSVWAMKEYGVTESWIKVSNIDLQCVHVMPSTRFCPRNFILWAKGEILMVHNHLVDDDGVSRYKRDLVLYNIGSRKSRHIFPITKSVNDMCRYKESLALLLM